MAYGLRIDKLYFILAYFGHRITPGLLGDAGL
jgi:hypothetical protein